MLQAELKVNDVQIGYVHIHRLSPEHVPAGSGNLMCQYEWRLNINGVTYSSDEPLDHRYGDGAWALVAKVIKEAGRDGT